jgi:Zn finger protein HypA/HybF involved in hydrogenase expression
MPQSIESLLERGCPECGKKPLTLSNAHPVTERFALPKFHKGEPVSDDNLKWTSGRFALLCLDCVEEIRKK